MMLEPKTDNERARIEKRIKELRRKQSELVADQKKKGWDENPAELWQHAKLAAERDEFKKKIGRFPLRMVMREGPVPGTRHKEPGDWSNAACGTWSPTSAANGTATRIFETTKKWRQPAISPWPLY